MNDNSTGAVIFLAFFLAFTFLVSVLFIKDLRVRMGHAETDIRALEAKLHRPQPKPSCEVKGRTVVCHLPKEGS